ncbi:MAG: putative metal-binding motif-containing protein [Myxococcota bacterium]
MVAWLVAGCVASDVDGDGVTVAQGDCDDADPRVAPGVDEWCDGVDEDCDGSVDDDARDLRTFYEDADGDGYGDPDRSFEACEPEASSATSGSDCDDDDPKVNPGADDTDNKDRNCDGEIGMSAAGEWTGRCDDPPVGALSFEFALDLKDRDGELTGTADVWLYWAGTDDLYTVDYGQVAGTRTGYDLSMAVTMYLGVIALTGEVREDELVLVDEGYGASCVLTR